MSEKDERTAQVEWAALKSIHRPNAKGEVMNMQNILEIVVMSLTAVFFFGVVLYLSNLVGCLSKFDDHRSGHWLRIGMQESFRRIEGVMSMK